MKKRLSGAALWAVFFSIGVSTAIAQNVEITIRVNTEAISEDNINQQVSLEDSNGNTSPFGADHSQFLTNIFSEGFVDWIGVSNDNAANTVEVKKISKKSGSRGQVLKKATYRGSGNRLRGQAKAFDPNEPDEEYAIVIKVSTRGNKKYTIDPKLKISN